MAQRVKYMGRCVYNTRGNRVKFVRTPGHRLVLHKNPKIRKHVRCADTGVPLNGVGRYRGRQAMRVPKVKKHVTRAYGGNLSPIAVKNRILRAFLVEEQKIVKALLAEKKKLQNAEEKP